VEVITRLEVAMACTISFTDNGMEEEDWKLECS
jgi:hypothetical protein